MTDSDTPDPPLPAAPDAPEGAESLDELIARYSSVGPLGEDYVDPDLERLDRRPPLFQLGFILIVMGFAAFVGWTLRFDAAYYFADETPIELGAAEDLASVLAGDPDYLRGFESNVYAHVSGIPQRRAVAGDEQYAQLVGAAIFVQSEREDAGADPLLRDVRVRLGPQDRQPRYYIDTRGRLLAIDRLGRSFGGFLDFYREGYDLWFCGLEMTSRQRDFQRLTARELATELGREPTEAEVAAAFPCTYGVLVQADVAPKDHLGYLIALLFIGLVELAGLAYVLRWSLQMRAALRA